MSQQNPWFSYSRNKDKIPESVDAVVIGSGLGGLTTALKLAQNGFKTVVCEQHAVPGGYAHSFTRKKYRFDVSLHHIGGLNPEHSIYKVLDGLGVLNRLTFTPKKTLFSAQLPEFTITVPNTQKGLIKRLEALFPQEKEGLSRLFSFLVDLKNEIMGPWVDADYVPPKQPLLPLYGDKTFGEIIDEFVKDSTLKAVLSQFWTLVGLPPDRATASFSTCVFNSYFLEGSFDIKGGGAALTRAMTERLAELGSLSFVNAAVAAISLDKENRANGVVLSDGRSIAASIVVSNASPHHTFFDLLPEHATKPIFKHRLQQMVPSISFFVTYIALDCHPSTLGIPESTFFFNHRSDTESAYQRALAGDVSVTDWAITSYENSSIVSYPAKGGIVTVVEVTDGARWMNMSEEEYRAEKERISKLLIKKYNKRFPGLKKHAVLIEYATPKTMSAYTGNYNGAIYGLAQLPEQANSKRLRNVTPIPNLYLTGAWTWAGGGYEGAIMSGVQTAVSIFKNHEKPKKNSSKKIKNKFDGYFSQEIMVYPRDVSIGNVASTATLLRFMDRGRVDAGEAILAVKSGESMFDRYNIQVYSIELIRHRDVHPATTIRLFTKYMKRSPLRAICHQVFTDSSGEILTEGLVELVRLNQEKKLDTIPDVITEQCTMPPLLSRLRRNGPPVVFHPNKVEGRVRVYTEDSDLLGVTFHVNYLRFSHQMLFDYLVSRKKNGEQWTYWVYNSFRIHYLHSTHVGEEITVAMSARRTDNGIIVDQTVLLPSGTTATQISFEPEFRDIQGRPVALPSALYDLIGDEQ